MEEFLDEQGVKHQLIHWLTGGQIACSPHLHAPHGDPAHPRPRARTVELDAVSCMLCRQTADYHDARKRQYACLRAHARLAPLYGVTP